MANPTDALLAERGKQHGDYAHQSTIAQGLKGIMRSSPGWEKLTHPQRDNLEMIATKISRILAGDPNHPDHWDDLAGYPRLIARIIENSAAQRQVRSTPLPEGLSPLQAAMKKVDENIG
jgi:hypothetical protein